MSHIAILIPGFDRIGGAERQAILLAKELIQRGWKVSVVTLSGSAPDAAIELQAAGAACLNLRMRKGLADPRGWIRFHRWLKREAPDIVHTHLPHAAWFARWSRLGAPARVLVDTLHSSSTGDWGRHLGYRYSRWLPDSVTAVSRAVAETHLAAGMATAGKLTVLPNGVDVQFYRPDPAMRAPLRRELGLTHEFLWLAAGRLEPVKDYPTLLRAMAELPEAVRLVIAGTGPLEGQLRSLTGDLALASRVRFLGFEPDVRHWMQAADGFVLSSRWEGLPMGLLEAAACALPAVATDVPGTREAVVDGQTGFLAPASNAATLQDAMARIMQMNAEERQAMGERARQTVVERYSLEAVVDRWEALYAELMLRHPRPLRWPGAN
jgi:glycosyltransferase involved in cell wall biosynthesis